MEYKKSYKGFVIWFIVFLVLCFCCAIIPMKDINLLTLLIYNMMTIGMAILTWIIYKNEKIYWYTGLSYEEAKRASSEQRKKYAMRHFKRFAILAVAYVVYSIIAYCFTLPIGVSTTVVLIGMVGTAISTMNIKLEK